MAYSDPRADRERGGTSFIGSFLEAPDQTVIVLRGDIDAGAVTRLGEHIEEVVQARSRPGSTGGSRPVPEPAS